MLRHSTQLLRKMLGRWDMGAGPVNAKTQHTFGALNVRPLGYGGRTSQC